MKLINAMMRVSLIVIVLFGLSAGFKPLSLLAHAFSEESKKVDTYTIISGVGVGQINKNTSRKSLVELFGDANVKDVDVHIGEGTFCRGTQVTFESNNTLLITWLDEESESNVHRIYFVGRKWSTPRGIGPSSSSREIEKTNGKPFKLYGFGWDYAGTVDSWEGGLLESDIPMNRGNSIVIRLSTEEGGFMSLSLEEENQIMGMRHLLSSHPVVRKLNLKPYEFFMTLDHDNWCEFFDA